MIRHLYLMLLTSSLLAAVPAPPAGHGQVEREVETFSDPHPPKDDPERSFLGQRATTGKLVLTASNGFFDHGIQAAGESSVKDAAPNALIHPDFEYLHHWTKKGATARWHVWVEKPGLLYVNLHLANGKPRTQLECKIADSSQTLTIRPEKDPAKPQGSPLTFRIPTAGWHTFFLTLKNEGDVGQFHRAELFGPAMKNALLLRTRWRPAAAHARFYSSKVPKPTLWVMSSRSSPKAAVSSYSPITTPFGYFGTSFKADGTSSGSANFSLWSYGRGKPTPQAEWSHMLAAGSPDALFGSFGHEGSGVKLRGGWTPFAGEKEVTLALRYEEARPWIRWYGYYLDQNAQRFRLYAVAAKWIGDRKKLPSLNPGSFVEQPGPPQRRRCGDLLRDVHRRGWMLDENKTWHAVDRMNNGKPSEPQSKHWTVTEDGWFSTGMGGMPRRPSSGKQVELKSTTIPAWLDERAIEDLHRLPATIGPRTFSEATASTATFQVPITELNLAAGEKATVTVYYGLEDCLTFSRDLGYKEAKTQFWQNKVAPQPIKEGENSFTLKKLSPDTTYYLRILVESPRGRIWSFETDSFTTLEK